MSTITLTLRGDLQPFQPTSNTFIVNSIRDLIRALESQIQGFREYLTNRAKSGAQYQIVINGSRDISEACLTHGVEDCTVEIIPVIEAGNGSVARIIAGVGLIALGAFTGGIGFISGASLILTGTALALGGISSLFNAPKNDAKEDKQRSFVFSGAVNTAATGNRVPIVFGCGYKGRGLIVGSLTASASIRSFYEINRD